MTTMRLDRKTLSNTLWVTKTTVKRSSCHSSSRSLLSLKRVISSSAANGSSINSSARLGHQPARDRDAHLHAAGKLARHGVLEAGQVHALQHLRDRRRGLGARHALQPQRQPDIVEDAGPGQQRRLLEHEADVGAVRRAAAAPVEHAGGRRRQAGDQPQRRRLAAARRPEQAQEIAFADRQVDVAQRRDAVGEDLADIAQRQQRLGRHSPDAGIGACATCLQHARRLTSSGRARRPC